MMAPTYPERIRGDTVRHWEGHRSVPHVNITNIRSYVFTTVEIAYVPINSRGNTVRAWRSVPPVTVTRKGKGAICRSYRTVMKEIPYDYRVNTVLT